MGPTLFRTLAGLGGVAALSLTLLGGGCSSDAPRAAPSEGPAGQIQAGLMLATAGFVETTVIQGRNQPTVVRFASDGRVFVAEKAGRIWVYDALNDTTPTLFANLADRVHDFWDRGLLGLALDPDFPAKPYVYVLYAYDGDPGGPAPKWGDGCPSPPGATGDGCVISGRLSRFTANGNVAGAETVLVEGWRQQYPSHSIGQVEFGPDGALYASGGEGASFNFVDYGQDGAPLNPLGDPPVAAGVAQTPPSAEGGALRAQSPRRSDGPTLLNGSVIRVSPMTGAGLPDNPLAASDDENAKRIIAYGLRNPFRIAARPGKNELWIADVGWDQWEELNRIPLGGAQPLNFGWPCYEGAGKQAGYDAADLALCESLYSGGGHTPPFFTYAHGGGVSAADNCGRGSSSVTGIAFYEGGEYPAEYQGAMFFADFSRRCIYVMDAGADGEPARTTARSFHVDADGPVFLTTGPGGDLFYAALTSGTIQRISYLRPAAAFTASPKQGQVPLLVSFDASSSVKALPSDELSYAWDLDGDGEFDDSTEAEPVYLYDTIGNVQTRLRVTDQRGISDTSAALVIKASAEPPPVSTPPEVFIDTPTADLQWQVGDNISFSGHARDAEDGDLPASALSWQILIQHCPDGCHIHELLSYDGVASGSFSAEDHEYPMHLELLLTATDSSGQKRTARRALEPKTVTLTFDTEPSGLQLVVGSTAQPTPFVRRVIVGSKNSASAPDPQAQAGAAWKFSNWSDGLARTHVLPQVTVAARYVATYQPGGGLTGQYFDNLAYGGSSLARIDPVVDFNWGTGSPDAALGPDTFSVRWAGQINADFAETYTFSTTSDDGVRLSIDGAVVIDHFVKHAATLDTGTLALTPGWHPILLEYFENTGGALIDLSWSSPSQPEEIVPESHLRPGCGGGTNVCTPGMRCNADELCVPQCDSSQCTADEHCKVSGGACVSRCTDVTCLASDACNRGVCEDRCLQVVCGTGQHCTLGECLDDPPTGGAGGAGSHAGSGGAGGAGGHAGSAGASAGGADTTPSAGGAPNTPSEAGVAGAPPTEEPAAGGNSGQPPVLTNGGAPAAGASSEPNGGTPNPGEQQPMGGVAPGAGGAAEQGGGGSGGSTHGCSFGAARDDSSNAGSFSGLALAVGLLVRRRRWRSSATRRGLRLRNGAPVAMPLIADNRMLKRLALLSLFSSALACTGAAPSTSASGASGNGGALGSGGLLGGGGAGGVVQGGGAGSAQGASGAGASGGGGTPGGGGPAGVGGGASGFGGAAGTAGAQSGGAAGSDGGNHWVGTWACAPQPTETANVPPAPGLSGNTLRQMVRVSIGGTQLRLKLSNDYGTSPVTLSSVHLALSKGGGAIDTTTDKALTFNGMPGVTIAAAKSVWSDTLDFKLAPLSDLAISMRFSSQTGDITSHSGSRTTSFLQSGDAVSSASLASAAQTEHWYFISGLDVMADSTSAAIVVLGDSITDGRGSTTDQNNRWTDILAKQLQGSAATSKVGVLNLGIGGNAVVTGGLGPPAVERFDRDVLGQSGARWLIVLEGVNDIGESTASVTASLIDAYKSFIAKSKQANLRAFGVPILPIVGSQYESGESQRKTVNDWIRTSNSFDAVIDLDAVVRDPANQTQLLAAYDSGDHLHPSPAGYKKMGESVDLALFTK